MPTFQSSTVLWTRSRKRIHRGASLMLLFSLLLTSVMGSEDILEIRDDYFWSPARGSYYIPRGIAYQVWNPPVGANQSLDQVEYDLNEIKKLHANSVRAEFVWGEVEPEDDVFDWRKPDFLISQAEKLGLKLFIIIGFQYPPGWFNPDWYGIDDQGGFSSVLNYSHPDAHATYQDYIRHVCERYKNSSAVGAWILGNEYAFFDLWEDPVKWAIHRFLGYDPVSQTNFQIYLDGLYEGDIQKLNNNWQSEFSSFSDVIMPRGFAPDRDHHGFHDLIQWRKRAIGDFVAVGAKAAKEVDPNHLVTYSMVGGIFNANDANNTAEDAKAIVDRCEAAGAPLDFWSINNYAWAEVGQELRSGDFGIAKYQAQAGLPVMISETGHSSTEDLFNGAAERQPETLPGQVWESLLSGAIGTHVFTWNDRPNFTEDFFLRERGFGIVTPARLPKPNGVFGTLRNMFLRMDELNIDKLLGGSTHPDPDMQFFWSVNADMGWPQANVENALLWGAFKRLGYQPGLMDDAQFASGSYTNAPALILSRAFRMDPEQLDHIATDVIQKGIHLHATFDLPGQFDTYHRPNPKWETHMENLFGLDVSEAIPGWDSGATNLFHRVVPFRGNRTFGQFSSRYRDEVRTLKIWHGLKATSGNTIVNHTGFLGTEAPMPALHVKDLGVAKSAINTFALGDIAHSFEKTKKQRWDFHTQWLTTIYRDYFGIIPKIDLNGRNADYIFSDFRTCSNGSILISLLNGHTESANITLNAPDLISGLKIENLTHGGVIDENSNGQLSLSLTGDEFVLLYAYESDGEQDQSLVSSLPKKIRFIDAPDQVWPSNQPYPVMLEMDSPIKGSILTLQLERLDNDASSSIASANTRITDQSRIELAVQIPLPPSLDPSNYFDSSDRGARFRWHAILMEGGRIVSETTLPVRFNWPIRPVRLPDSLEAGRSVDIEIAWEQLPSFSLDHGTFPINRASLWDSLTGLDQQYEIRVQLTTEETVVAESALTTREATASGILSFELPNTLPSDLRWTAQITPIVHSVSFDVIDGFEGRVQGEDSPPPLFAPWVAFVHRDSQKNDEGILRDRGTTNNAAWMSITAAPSPDNSPQLHFRSQLESTWEMPPPEELTDDMVIQFDLKEISGRRLRIGAALENGEGHQAKYEAPYRAGEDGWHRDFTARLERMTDGPNGGIAPGEEISSIAITAALLESNKTYDILIDNIRFSTLGVEADFDDQTPMKNSEREFPPPRISPWGSYHNSEFGNTRWLNEGVGAGGPEGSQSAFLVVNNPPNPGGFSVMGIVSQYEEAWALPENPKDWSEFFFSCYFKEESNLACNVELQVKNPNGPNGELYLTHKLFPYVPSPGNDGWQEFSATLDEFEIPSYATGFDPSNVSALIINIQLLEKSQNYVGFFDDIRFDGPDQITEFGSPFSSSQSIGVTHSELSILRADQGEIILNWIGPAQLQHTPSLTEPWIDLPNSAPPFPVPAIDSQGFFRLR